MKKSLIVLFLALSTLAVFGETPANTIASYMATAITAQTDGHIAETYTSNAGNSVYVIQLPSYYTFDLLSVIVRTWSGQYSDIRTLIPWKRSETALDRIFTVFGVGEINLIFSYCAEFNTITIAAL